MNTNEPETIIEWQPPKSVLVLLAKDMQRQLILSSIFLVMTTVGLAVLTYYLFGIIDPELPALKPCLMVGIGVSLLVCSLPFAGWLSVAAPPTYKITEKDIINTGTKHPRQSWERVKQARIQEQEPSGYQTLQLLTESQQVKSYILPSDDDKARDILDVVERFVSVHSEFVDYELPVTMGTMGKAFLAIVAVLYIAAASWVLCHIPPQGIPGKTLFQIIFLSQFFLGPGTIACLILYGRRLFRPGDAMGWAIATNMLSAFTVAVVAVLIRFITG